MKIVIEDILSKTRGEREVELPSGTTVRFEVDNKVFSVSLLASGICITKISGIPELGESHGDQIRIIPKCANEIIIK